MQVRMSKLSLGKNKFATKKWKIKTQKLKQKKTKLNKTKNINKNLQKNTNNKTFEWENLPYFFNMTPCAPSFRAYTWQEGGAIHHLNKQVVVTQNKECKP